MPIDGSPPTFKVEEVDRMFPRLNTMERALIFRALRCATMPDKDWDEVCEYAQKGRLNRAAAAATKAVGQSNSATTVGEEIAATRGPAPVEAEATSVGADLRARPTEAAAMAPTERVVNRDRSRWELFQLGVRDDFGRLINRLRGLLPKPKTANDALPEQRFERIVRRVGVLTLTLFCGLLVLFTVFFLQLVQARRAGKSYDEFVDFKTKTEKDIAALDTRTAELVTRVGALEGKDVAEYNTLLGEKNQAVEERDAYKKTLEDKAKLDKSQSDQLKLLVRDVKALKDETKQGEQNALLTAEALTTHVRSGACKTVELSGVISRDEHGRVLPLFECPALGSYLITCNAGSEVVTNASGCRFFGGAR